MKGGVLQRCRSAGKKDYWKDREGGERELYYVYFVFCISTLFTI